MKNQRNIVVKGLYNSSNRNRINYLKFTGRDGYNQKTYTAGDGQVIKQNRVGKLQPVTTNRRQLSKVLENNFWWGQVKQNSNVEMNRQSFASPDNPAVAKFMEGTPSNNVRDRKRKTTNLPSNGLPTNVMQKEGQKRVRTNTTKNTKKNTEKNTENL